MIISRATQAVSAWLAGADLRGLPPKDDDDENEEEKEGDVEEDDEPAVIREPDE